MSVQPIRPSLGSAEAHLSLVNVVIAGKGSLAQTWAEVGTTGLAAAAVLDGFEPAALEALVEEFEVPDPPPHPARAALTRAVARQTRATQAAAPTARLGP